MSKSDTDPLNSAVNQRGNPSQYIPPDRAKSNPNISVSRFIDESLYTGLGTCLQSQMEGMETRITRVVERFQKLKAQINEREKSLKNRAVSPVKINQQLSSFSKIIQELSSQALLARVLLPICERYFEPNRCYPADKTEWIK